MPSDPETLRALAARCEAGESGARLDREIAYALGLGKSRGFAYSGRLYATESGPTFDVAPMPEWPPLTSSLDAQAALGVRIGSVVCVDDGERVSAVTWGRPRFGASAPTEPLARLAAILRALAARAEAGE